MKSLVEQKQPQTSKADLRGARSGIAVPAIQLHARNSDSVASGTCALPNAGLQAGATVTAQLRPFQLQGIDQLTTTDKVQLKAFEPVQKKANTTGLPDNLKIGVENLSGFAMDDVKVHYNSSMPRQLQAHAFAQGTDIHVAPGQEKHLPHEAWHIAQQKQGRVQPTMQMKQGIAVNDDAGLEQEADVMGAKALQMKAADGSRPLAERSVTGATVQMAKLSDKEVADLVKWATRGETPANKTAILLAIYNQMALDIDPVPPKFTALSIAKTALKTAGKIDNEDYSNLDVAAAEQFRVMNDPAEILKAKQISLINSKAPAIEGKYANHIFKGDFAVDGKPSGYHSINGVSTTHEAYGTKTDIGGGVYQKSVRAKADHSNKKTNQSTFFPDVATREQIIKGITSVEELGLTSITYVHPNVDGIVLTKRGNTIYPAGGSDSLLAE